MMTRKNILKMAVSLAVLALFVPTVQAGPELICWPFEIGGAKSLPWGGSGWHATRADYDLSRLTADTLALLGRDVPVLVRMETLRRAAIYAKQNRQAAKELLLRLEARAETAAKSQQGDVLALFDYGYFAEAYKQAMYEERGSQLAADVRGFDWVARALESRSGDAQLEFGAALVARVSKLREQASAHAGRAVAGAEKDALLAQNLVTHAHLLGLRGNNLSEIRSSLTVAKN